jgi:hypothetical protein
MGPDGIVFPSPSFDQHLGFLQSEKNLSVEEAIPELAVEAFIIAVLPWAPRFNVKGLNTDM